MRGLTGKTPAYREQQKALLLSGEDIIRLGNGLAMEARGLISTAEMAYSGDAWLPEHLRRVGVLARRMELLSRQAAEKVDAIRALGPYKYAGRLQRSCNYLMDAVADIRRRVVTVKKARGLRGASSNLVKLAREARQHILEAAGAGYARRPSSEVYSTASGKWCLRVTTQAHGALPDSDYAGTHASKVIGCGTKAEVMQAKREFSRGGWPGMRRP